METINNDEIPTGCKATAVTLAFLFIAVFALGFWKLFEIIGSWI